MNYYFFLKVMEEKKSYPIKSCLKNTTNENTTNEKKSVNFGSIYFKYENEPEEQYGVEVSISDIIKSKKKKKLNLNISPELAKYNDLPFESRRKILPQDEDYGKLLNHNRSRFVFEKKTKLYDGQIQRNFMKFIG